MTITVIKPHEMGYNFGEDLGSKLGTGLQQGLRGVAEAKISQMLGKHQQEQQRQQQEQQSQAFQQAGFSPQDVALLQQFPPEIQFKLLSSLQSGAQQEQQMQPQMQQQPQLTLSDLLGDKQSQQNAIMQALGKTNIKQQQEPIQRGATKSLQPLTPAQKIAANPYETPQEKLAKRKMEQQEKQFQQKEKREERKLSHIQQREIDKETLPVYTEISKEAKAAKANDMRLNRMEKLINKGDLTNSKWAAVLHGLEHTPVIGKVASSILKASTYKPDTLEFEKLTYDFLKDAKSVFGSRLTNFDVDSYLKTLPNLTLSDVGKKRVIQNLKLFNKAAEIRKKTMDEIIYKNEGLRPRNLDSLVDKIASKELDSLAEEFKSGIPKTSR